VAGETGSVPDIVCCIVKRTRLHMSSNHHHSQSQQGCQNDWRQLAFRYC